MVEPMSRLSDLPTAEPTAACRERIRQRCRAQLATRRRREASPRPAAAPAREGGVLRLWPPAIALLALAYFAEVMGLAYGMYVR
jgi:hypothetical protein